MIFRQYFGFSNFRQFSRMLSHIWIVRSIFSGMLTQIWTSLSSLSICPWPWSYMWIVRSIFAPMLMSRGVAGGRVGSPGGRRAVAGRPPDGDGGSGGGDGDVPTTLPSGQSPGPSRPGTKYPVRGNPSLRQYTAVYMYHQKFLIFTS